MRHAYVYFGPLDENFRGLKSSTTTYYLPDGKNRAVKSVAVDGIVVAVLQDGPDFFAAMIDGVRLDRPVKLSVGAHTGFARDGKPRGFGPSQITYVDEPEPVLQLLADANELNRLRRKELAVVAERLPSRPIEGGAR